LVFFSKVTFSSFFRESQYACSTTMSGIVSKMHASLPQNQAEEKTSDIQSVLMASGQPQAVFIPTPPLEQTSKPKSLKHISAKQIKKLREFLNAAAGKSQSGLNQVLASPIITKKYFEEDMIQEVDNLNWLYPEILPHKYGVKRRHSVSNEYRAIVHNLKKQRMGLDEFPLLNDTAIPQLLKIYISRASIAAAIIDAIGSSNAASASATPRVAAGGVSSGRVNNLAGGANNSLALGKNPHDSATASSSQVSRLAGGTVKPALGSYRDLNVSISSRGASASSVVSDLAKEHTNGFLKGSSPSVLSNWVSVGYSPVSKGSKYLVRDNKGMAGSQFGSFISVIPSTFSLSAGDQNCRSMSSVDFQKQPCVCLFKAVDPPPRLQPLAGTSSR